MEMSSCLFCIRMTILSRDIAEHICYAMRVQYVYAYIN